MKKIVFAIALASTFTVQAADNTTVAPAKAATCVACHGPQGNSTNPLWPNIAGQHASYLEKQLYDFKKVKTRDVPVMTTIAATLSDQDIKELAAYYAKLPLAQGATPQKYVKRGEAIYRGGDLNKHITACIACHGPRGTGNAQANFPVLSGQHAQYTIQQLQTFKEGKRSNDLNEIMRDISNRMNPEDMEAVAYYMQGLH
ncbi:cytochrome c4 [Legionella beliardensis]|uniref:Cytochrome c4 n=1 Tax=Legionella beliardensis TaxID=91822 RepID=A0A378HXW3_9GAMM|nr:c-type cytochrome [Legionella beliardensis]STX27652.1 cytochrome c4 [Legionella beliardensis]